MDEFLSKQVQGLPDEKDRVIRDYEEDQLEVRFVTTILVETSMATSSCRWA